MLILFSTFYSEQLLGQDLVISGILWHIRLQRRRGNICFYCYSVDVTFAKEWTKRRKSLWNYKLHGVKWTILIFQKQLISCEPIVPANWRPPIHRFVTIFGRLKSLILKSFDLQQLSTIFLKMHNMCFLIINGKLKKTHHFTHLPSCDILKQREV